MMTMADLERPEVQRYIRRKLGIINLLHNEKQQLEEEIHRREELLKRRLKKLKPPKP